MAAQKMIAVREFCTHYNIPDDFIRELQHNEMIELVMIRRSRYIPLPQLHKLEKITRLYNDLGINIEGIQTIMHLLQQLNEKENEIRRLRNLVAFYNED